MQDEIADQILPPREKEAFLQKSALFTGFTTTLRQKLMKFFKIETFKYGERVIYQQAPCNTFCIIVEGEVTITHFIEESSNGI